MSTDISKIEGYVLKYFNISEFPYIISFSFAESMENISIIMKIIFEFPSMAPWWSQKFLWYKIVHSIFLLTPLWMTESKTDQTLDHGIKLF